MRRFRIALAAAVAAAVLAAADPLPEARAQERVDRIEDIVVVGSRRTGRAVTDSPAPVDVIPGGDIAGQGNSDTTEALRTLVPSWHVNTNPISDEAALVRPANLRGLAPDHTLVLLNGKRRHRAAVVTFLGNGVSNGAQGPDVNVFPAIALKRVEVLRDSASAQYGSDAIAGVLNFVLRDAPEGGAVEAQWGETYEGDGEVQRLSANVGMPVGRGGFTNLSAEWREAEPTVRSVQRADAQASIDAGNTGIRQPYAQTWGQSRVSDDHKLFLNFGLGQAYAFGNYAARTAEDGFFFRHPDTRAGVFVDGSGNRLLGELDAGATNCPAAPAVGTPEDRVLLDQIAANDRCWSFNESLPSGFTPRFGGKMTDAAGTFGVRDTAPSGLAWDASLTWGQNAIDYFIHDTINPSFGPYSPTSFDIGSYVQNETTFNLDLSHEFGIGAADSPLYAAAGVEWREEKFRIRTGEPASWEAGPLAGDGFGIGSNGFAGFSDRVAGTWRRDNVGVYLDLENAPTPDLTLTAAARWEDFSDFGDTFNYKGGFLWRTGPTVALRGTFGTGFRAPTVAQQHVTKESTDIDVTGGVLRLVQNGIIPPTNPVAVAKGGRPLEPEESVTFGAGVVVDQSRVRFTADYFHIDVDGRLGITDDKTVTQAEKDQLVAAGYGFAQNLSSIRFFVNDLDTRTQGIDVTATVDATGLIPLMRRGTAEVEFAGNWTRTTVRNPDGLDDRNPARRVLQIEESLPKLRGSLTARNRRDGWRWLARVNYFGTYTVTHLNETSLLIRAGREFTFDLEAGYQMGRQAEIVFGANNVLNNYPDRNSWATEAGALYPEYSPMGFAGGFYYARLRYEF